MPQLLLICILLFAFNLVYGLISDDTSPKKTFERAFWQIAAAVVTFMALK